MSFLPLEFKRNVVGLSSSPKFAYFLECLDSFERVALLVKFEHSDRYHHIYIYTKIRITNLIHGNERGDFIPRKSINFTGLSNEFIYMVMFPGLK